MCKDKPLEVPKTERERVLNNIYMSWIRIHGKVPNSIVKRFKNDIEMIRIENKLYNKNS